MRRIAVWMFALLLALPALADKTIARGEYELYTNGIHKGRERYHIDVDKKKDRWVLISDLMYKLPFHQSKRGYINLYMYPEYTRTLSGSTFTEFKYRMKVEDFSETDLVEADQSARETIDQNRQVYDFSEQVQQQTDDVMRSHVDFGLNAGGVRVAGNVIRFAATKLNVARSKDEKIQGPLAILDPMVPSIYLPLLDQLDGPGPTWEFWFALPQYLKYRPGRVEYQGVEETVFQGKSYLLMHYDVKVQENLFASFWVDRAKRIVQISVPKDGLIAVLSDHQPQAFEKAEPRIARQVIEEESPFRETRVTVPCQTVTLGATMTAPLGSGPFPTALLVQDLGAMDRDGNETGGARANAVKQMAFALAERGIASLRWDARGVGESGGNAEQSALPERVEEVQALSAWLKASPQVKPGALFLVATGLGGWAAAQSLPASAPAGLVVVGYPAKPVLRLWKEQVAALSDPEAVRKAYADIESLEASLGEAGEWAPYRGGRRYVPSVRQLAGVDPRALLDTVRVPALLAYADRDLVVQAFHRDIVNEFKGPSVSTVVLSGVDHSLVKIDPERGFTGRVDKEAVKVLTDWILERASAVP